MELQLKESDINSLNDWAGYLSFQPNFIMKALSDCPLKTIFIDKGNQGGGTASVMKDYVRRILGDHPIESKNLRPNIKIRTIRFGAQTLPLEKDAQGEVTNTVYPQFKKFFPSSLIKKDITFRNHAMILRDPQGGPDVIIEFVSYGQESQSQAGVQRWSIYLDEEAPEGFYEEQIPRLIASDGDLIVGLTPVEHITWTFDKLFERAEVIYNSPTIIDYLFKTTGIKHKIREFTGNKTGIGIIRAATDDNPTLDPKAIEEKMSKYDDVGTMEIRRYGIFHQMSGVIYKSFDPCLVINRDRYFPDGMPHDFIHARGIDFHTHTNWACGWIALSRENEAFIYNEFNPSPDRMITMEIAREVVLRSKDYKFAINLIDPMADIQQANTGVSPLDDINRMFREFRRENLGTGGYWETWDTKNEIGRDRIKERIRNSRLCGRPFNNRDSKNPEKYLPTIWILDNCVQTIYGFKSWRWDEWASKSSQATKDDKNKPQDKYSHFPITIECIFKHPGFSVNRNRGSMMPYREPAYRNAFNARV